MRALMATAAIALGCLAFVWAFIFFSAAAWVVGRACAMYLGWA